MISGKEKAKRVTLRIGDLLLDRKLITQDNIERALEYQKTCGKRILLGEALVELGFVTDEQVLEILANLYDVPYVDINHTTIDSSVYSEIPSEIIEKHRILPCFLVNNVLTVAVSEPSNVFILEEIERQTGFAVQIVVATQRSINKYLSDIKQDEHLLVIDEMVDVIDTADIDLIDKADGDIADIDYTDDESPVIRLVNGFILGAVQEGVSDIHVEPSEVNVRVRYRIDGRLYEKITLPSHMLSAIVSRIKIMADMDISERRIPQDGGISVVVNKQGIDLRVSTMPGKYGEKVVLRVIDRSNTNQQLSQLGFSHDMLQRYKHVVSQSNGIVLVTGPTGSGKSTTLYASLQEINQPEINISTVEDPVEYSMHGVNQFQVNDKAGFTFPKALRALLRQDPDVIMVGEIRDEETARISTQAALTGHLVVSTLHTNDALSAVTRLVDIGIEPYLVAATIRGVLSQRLVRKICTHCKEEHEIDDETLRLMDLWDIHLTSTTMPVGRGCSKCRNIGYSGRLGIYGLLTHHEEVCNLIAHEANIQDLRKVAISVNALTTLKDDGIRKVQDGQTSIEEIVRVVNA